MGNGVRVPHHLPIYKMGVKFVSTPNSKTPWMGPKEKHSSLNFIDIKFRFELHITNIERKKNPLATMDPRIKNPLEINCITVGKNARCKTTNLRIWVNS